MKSKNLINTLLLLRLAYYRASILERLRRFKLLIFFILAMTVPTVAFLLQVLQMASTNVMNGVEHATYFFSLIIFQLTVTIWVGSQYECLKIADVESYLRTLKVPDFHFFMVEFLFCSVLNLPFLAFLVIGVFLSANQSVLLLEIAHFIYVFSSLLFLSMCLIFSRAVLISLLIITNLLFVYFNGLMISVLLAVILGAIMYFVLIKCVLLPIKINRFLPISKLRFSRFSPNIYLRLKTLLIWNQVYTTCIFGINWVAIFILISYILSQGMNESEPVHTSFLVTLNLIIFFCSLLIYKLTETRKTYGVFFSVFYSRFQNYLFDLIAVYIVALCHFLALALIGFCLGFSVLVMFKCFLIATMGIIIFASLNCRFSFYGPVFSLLLLVGILVISRRLL